MRVDYGKDRFSVLRAGRAARRHGKKFYDIYLRPHCLTLRRASSRYATQDVRRERRRALRQTENTQPCLYLADLAAAYALRDSGLQPEAVAGFSLGEIPALAFAGAYDALTGFRLACARGASMARAGRNVNASMAAIVKLPDETVERLCAAYDHVWPVNYNCDGQIAVSGDRDELERLYADVAAAGDHAAECQRLPRRIWTPLGGFSAILADTVLQKLPAAKPRPGPTAKMSAKLLTADQPSSAGTAPSERAGL